MRLMGMVETRPPLDGEGEGGSGTAPQGQDAGAEQDLVLLTAARAGDRSAMSALYERHYAAALRTARGVGGVELADDLVSDAFARVFTSILQGSGPERSFRPYLASTIRHLFVDRVRKGAHEFLVADSDVLERLQPDDAEAFVDESVVVDVLSVLPARWREILWRTVILDEPLSLAGARMGLNANAAAALSFRARGGLRKAYLARLSEDDRREESSGFGTA